jgi:protein-S-isoprenylcysteine O-methyltransferase Ste14
MSLGHMNSLFARALLAFLALPGTVAFVVPLLLVVPRGRQPVHLVAGMVPLAAGSAILLWTVREFYVAGRGTLAPWEPPRRLVVSGPYRASRNPMYVGVALILCGWALLYESRWLALYATGIAVAFHLRVVLHEEPYLARTHREAWTRYVARVPRWVGVRTERCTNPGAHDA